MAARRNLPRGRPAEARTDERRPTGSELRRGAKGWRKTASGGAGFTVGASAPIFGLLGAIVLYGQRSGSSMARREGLQYALMMGVFGLLMPGIDNWAHAGGFAGGWLMAKILDPLKPERIDHLAAAVVCVLLTIASIAVSIVHGMALFAAAR